MTANSYYQHKDYTIELKYGVFNTDTEPSNYVVYEWDVWKKGSVLQGQTMKSFCQMYEPTEKGLEQALEHYPTASQGFQSANNTYDHLPNEDGYTSVSNGVCYHDFDGCGCYQDN